MIYPLASPLPVEYGWENGFIENSQVGLCIIGFLSSIWFTKQSKTTQIRWFWIIISPLWLIIITRELSWGACFLSAQSMNPLTGGTYSSSILSYKPYVYPILKVIGVAILVLFFITKQYQTLVNLFKNRDFPLLELLFVIIGALISTAAEEHMHLFIPFSSLFNAGQIQTMEELGEFGVYLALFAGQYRVYQAFCRNKSIN